MILSLFWDENLTEFPEKLDDIYVHKLICDLKSNYCLFKF